MPLKKIILAIALFSGCLMAQPGQCTVWPLVTTGCDSLYTFSATPDLATYVTTINASLVTLLNAAAARPQPPILMTSQNYAITGSTLSWNPTYYGPYGVTYQNMLYNAGITTQYNNIWAPSGIDDPSYTGGLGTPDCTNAGGTLPWGSTPAAGSGGQCWALYYEDLVIANAQAKGINMRFGFPGQGNTFIHYVGQPYGAGGSACGYTAPISTTQYTACIGPMMTALLARWHSHLTMTTWHVQVLEEPLGGTKAFTGTTFGTASIGTIISALCTDAATAISSGLSCEAAGENTDDTYFSDWISQSGHYGLNRLVIDLFPANCDYSSATGTPYSTTVLGFLATSGHWVEAATAANLLVDIGQSDAPEWCQSGTSTPPGLTNCYLCTLDVVWGSFYTGLQSAWSEVMNRAMAAYGVQSMTIFCSMPLLYTTADQNNDSCIVSGTETGVQTGMANLVSTLPPLGEWGQLNLPWQVSFQGMVSSTGVTGVSP